MYIDAIIELNNGLAALVGEFLIDPDVDGLVIKDEEGIPTGIQMASFPSDPDTTKKRVVYIRVTEEVSDLLQSKKFINKRTLALCPAGGAYDPDTETTKSIYDVLQEDADALAVYNKYVFYDEFTPNEEGIDIPNPSYGTFRMMGRFA